MLVGFRRATIAVHAADGTVKDTFVIEGKQNEGATSSANITGLAPTPVRVAGSDITYYIAQRGTGEVSVDFGLLDLSDEVNDAILGYEVSESGIAFVGRKTEAPYTSVLLESSNLKGETALLGFFKGKFTRESITLNTLNPAETYTPEPESYVFSASEDDKEGESNGQVLGKYVGADEAAITELRNLVLGTELPAG